MTSSLFPNLTPVDLPEQPKLTSGARLRARQDAQIGRNRHPITSRPLRDPAGEKCGTCVHRVQVNGGARSWPKCGLSTATHGPATDCLARFPACDRWEPRA